MLRFIWAEDEASYIGYQGRLPWNLPADMKHFKKLTSDHVIVMGRKTFESFPGLLPKREHVILSTSPILQRQYQDNPRVKIFSQIDQLRDWLGNHSNEIIDIIGGARLFEEFKNDVDVLEETKIHHIFVGDTKMPDMNYDDFKLFNVEKHPADDKNEFDYDFLEYKRIKK